MTDGNGLCYMRARYYSPMFMRFINADPLKGTIAENPSQNNYFYANGNPISYIDPFGTSAELSKSEAWHMLLDMGGMIPGWGMAFDFVNGAWYAYTGDWVNMGLSTYAMITFFGDITKVPKVAKDLSKIEKIVDAVTGTKTVDILSNKSFTNETGKVYNYVSSSKGYDVAKSDFDALNASNIKTYPNGTIVGELSDGRTLNLHSSSSLNGTPTLEIYDVTTGMSIKIRY